MTFYSMEYFPRTTLPLFIALSCYLVSSMVAFYSFFEKEGKRASNAKNKASWLSVAGMFLGVMAQTLFLVLAGKEEQSCPIHSLGEILIFISWSLGVFYLLIGSTYRLSLLGSFTAPLSLLLQGSALFLPLRLKPIKEPLPPAIEGHAALSLLAFGALGLGAIAAVMFLIQSAELKSQHPKPLAYQLPPMILLKKVTLRLLWIGLGLLTASFLLPLMGGISTTRIKYLISLLLWGGYLLLLLSHHTHYLSARHFAWGAILIFLVILLLLPGIEALSHLQ
jgi:HemX protein